MSYKHGAYGEISDSKAQSSAQGGTVVVYFGTAPVNLIRGYATAGIINKPVKLQNMIDVQNKVGYATDWAKFTLCEAFKAHFGNTVQNAGPIYIINVLDPTTHRKAQQTTTPLTFSNGYAEIESDTIILDTFAIADKTEGTDYSLSYDFAAGKVKIKQLASLGASPSATYYEVETTDITATTIIGTASNGVYTGIKALYLLYMQQNAIANILAAPSWSEDPDVYAELVSASQKINGHWDAFVLADIPLMDGETAVDTITKAINWKETNGYTSERAKVCWPMVKDGSAKLYHLSTVCAVTMLATDLTHKSIPMESPSNKEIMATAQYFGASATNQGFDQNDGNDLNEKGITTAVFWGGRWVLWGGHTAAYQYGVDVDARAIFDVNMRMLMHVTNGFQLRHGTDIDEPMTPQMKDSIVAEEQQQLDSLVGQGALIGTPTVLFIESENNTTDMMNGDFVWNMDITPAPPLKSATARVCYTDDGFAAFFE